MTQMISYLHEKYLGLNQEKDTKHDHTHIKSICDMINIRAVSNSRNLANK